MDEIPAGLTQPGDHQTLELPPGGSVTLMRSWLPADEADELQQSVLGGVSWSQPKITLFGRQVAIPRLQAWVGDDNARYAYSGTAFSPDPWHPAMQSLRVKLTSSLGSPFNSVLANLYRTGEDCMHWHADNEPELGPTPCIASVSVGATRDFLLKPRDRHCERISLSLGHGDLLVMRGHTQRHWLHSIPRRKRVTAARINLTFRYIDQA